MRLSESRSSLSYMRPYLNNLPTPLPKQKPHCIFRSEQDSCRVQKTALCSVVAAADQHLRSLNLVADGITQACSLSS